MKKIFSVAVFISAFAIKSFSQDYTLDSTRIHAYGNPGDLFQSSVQIQNNNGESSIVMHLERIVNNLPAGWGPSCFCSPDCIAPSIDTLTFIIPPSGTDSINPNFPSDLTPGTGFITAILYQEGFLSQVDTLAFTGSTLGTGITHPEENPVSIFPNPAGEYFEIIFSDFTTSFDITIYNILGKEVLKSKINSHHASVSISSLKPAVYFIINEGSRKKIIFIKK